LQKTLSGRVKELRRGKKHKGFVTDAAQDVFKVWHGALGVLSLALLGLAAYHGVGELSLAGAGAIAVMAANKSQGGFFSGPRNSTGAVDAGSNAVFKAKTMATGTMVSASAISPRGKYIVTAESISGGERIHF